MKRILFVAVISLLFTGLPGYGSEEKLPVIDGQIAVASVNGEPISIGELNRAIAASHAARPGEQSAGRIDYSKIMNRLVNTRLIVLEARNIGLDELPEVKEMVADYSRETLVKVLIEVQVKDIEPEEAEVERIYRNMVKEWKISSVIFDKEETAKKFEQELKSPDDFAEAMNRAQEQGTAKGVEVGKYLKDKDLAPQIARLVSSMEIGSISPIVSLDKVGFVVFKIEEVRVPAEEDTEAMARAWQKALARKKIQAAREYYQKLVEQYATINDELFQTLDYEAKEPGFDKLLQDNRVLLTIEGEPPVTVGEFTGLLHKRFFHGVERAIESKSINRRKVGLLEKILQDRILMKEALKQDIAKSDEYKKRVREYERSMLFGTFTKKVLSPDIQLDVKELEAYYHENSEEYTYPEMMKINSLIFRQKSDAEAAIEKLRKGTDFNWMSSRAEGQVAQDSKGLMVFAGNLLSVRSLPAEVQQALSGASTGDFRLYKSPEGYYYVLYIYYVVPAERQPFEEVKQKIAQRVYGLKLEEAVQAYADKLKEYYPVKIYGKDLQ